MRIEKTPAPSTLALPNRFVLALCAVFFVAACGASTTPGSSIPRTVGPAPSVEQSPPMEAAEEQAATGAPTLLNARHINIAILLPLSGDDKAVGKALLQAASMALFEAYDDRLTLVPYDTTGTREGAALAAQKAVDGGAAIILGPLFSGNVRAVQPILAGRGLVQISFSNDRSVAAPGRYIMGFQVENEVGRVMQFALDRGHKNFAGLFPDGIYGTLVREAFGDSLEATSGRVTAMERYHLQADTLDHPVRIIADYDRRKKHRDQEIDFLLSLEDDMTDEIAKSLKPFDTLEGVPFDALMVPEGGSLMRTLGPLLPYYEIDPNLVRFLGTGLMNDISLRREPPLQGAWFAAPEPAAPDAILNKLADSMGVSPPRIATLAYDAMSLVAHIMRSYGRDGLSDSDVFLNPRGFNGIDGLFRFTQEGYSERALAILEIRRSGFLVVDGAPKRFRGAVSGVLRAEVKQANDPANN